MSIEIILLVILDLLFNCLVFCLGVLYGLYLTRGTMKGWSETLKKWEEDRAMFQEMLEKIK
jgi:hypothetical protein